MNMLLLATAGGAIGAGTRHLVNVGMARAFGTAFPWGTLTVNIVGSLLMGILVELLVLRYSGSAPLRAFLGTGFLGGFTTFSAFSLDLYAMTERGDAALALAYAVGSVVVGLGALYAGIALVRGVLA